jgi:hypothetical protein
MCAKKKCEKRCLLAYKVYCDMELKQHNNRVTQYCDDKIGNKVPSNTKHSTNDYDFKKAFKTNLFLDGLQEDLWCINYMGPDYYPDWSKDICPIPIRSCIDSVDEEGADLLLSLCHCCNVTPRKTSRCWYLFEEDESIIVCNHYSPYVHFFFSCFFC